MFIDLATTLEGAQVRLTTCVSFYKVLQLQMGAPFNGATFRAFVLKVAGKTTVFWMSKVVFYVDDNSTSKNPNLESRKHLHTFKLSI